MTAALLVVAGLALLVAGAEVMIRGAVAVARGAGISPHAIGLTVIAFGTSAPELFVSVEAAMEGSPGIAIGNIVGSNIANILLMVGAAGLLRAFVRSGPPPARDCLVLLGATAAFLALAAAGMAERWHGAAMLAGLAGYLLYCYRAERRDGGGPRAREAEEAARPLAPGRAWLYTLGGLVAVVVGARLLVDGAIEIAQVLGVSETVIGITMVALGTSMPELATTAVAAARGHGDVALGNIIGSNIMNTLGILGAVAAIQPLPIPPDLLSSDLWVMAGATLAFVVAVLAARRLGRPLAISFLAVYAAYIAQQFHPVFGTVTAAFG